MFYTGKVGRYVRITSAIKTKSAQVLINFIFVISLILYNLISYNWADFIGRKVINNGQELIEVSTQSAALTMKIYLLTLLALASFTFANSATVANGLTAYGYLTKYGIPEAERIRKLEENAASRIVGGVPAGDGQYEYQVYFTKIKVY